MLIASDKMYNILSTTPIFTKQSGAVEACWAHNPEVRGSKPRSANYIFFFENGFSVNSRQNKSDFIIFRNELMLNLSPSFISKLLKKRNIKNSYFAQFFTSDFLIVL